MRFPIYDYMTLFLFHGQLSPVPS